MATSVGEKKIGHRLLDVDEVLRRLSIERSTLYHLMARGEFPKPRHLPRSRKNVWLESDIDQYIEGLA